MFDHILVIGLLIAIVLSIGVSIAVTFVGAIYAICRPSGPSSSAAPSFAAIAATLAGLMMFATLIGCAAQWATAA